jgi:hypothetical protein
MPTNVGLCDTLFLQTGVSGAVKHCLNDTGVLFRVWLNPLRSMAACSMVSQKDLKLIALSRADLSNHKNILAAFRAME